MLTFGDFIKFYEFYYSFRSFPKLSTPVINLVKSLRNGAAHNNCILADFAHGASRAPQEISQEISKIISINSNQRQKKLSCRPMLEFTCLLYVTKKPHLRGIPWNKVSDGFMVFLNSFFCLSFCLTYALFPFFSASPLHLRVPEIIKRNRIKSGKRTCIWTIFYSNSIVPGVFLTYQLISKIKHNWFLYI